MSLHTYGLYIWYIYGHMVYISVIVKHRVTLAEVEKGSGVRPVVSQSCLGRANESGRGFIFEDEVRV